MCHERPATYHIICSETGEMRALCTTCSEQEASVEDVAALRHSEQVLRDGKCDYCGAPAVVASVCGEIPGVMAGEKQFLCKQCRQDLNEFNRRPENALAEFDFEDEDVAKLEQESQQLAERQRCQDEFLRQRVKERKSP